MSQSSLEISNWRFSHTLFVGVPVKLIIFMMLAS